MSRGLSKGILVVFLLCLCVRESAQAAPDLLIWDCYKDPGLASSVLEYEDVQASKVLQANVTTRQPTTCMVACEMRGFHFSGIRNITQCWCGREVLYRNNKPAKCTYCPGNHNFRCGDPGLISVYFRPTGVPAYKFLKCVQYATEADREVMTNAQSELSYIGYRGSGYRQVTSCVQLCALKGFMYAGVTQQFWCRCGNELPKARQTECDQCQGNRSQFCGQKASISVYEIENVHTKAVICGGVRQVAPAASQVSLQCNTVNATITTFMTFTWQRIDGFGHVVTMGDKMSLTPSGDTLLIDDITKAESGRYRCTVENRLIANSTFGVSKVVVNLIVEDPPTVTLEQNQAAKQNQPVTFTCEVKPTSPTQKISVQWFFGATPLGPYSSTLPGGQNALPTPVETEDSQPVSIPGSPNELGGKKDLPPDVATPVAVQSQRPRPRLTPHDISNNMVFSRSGTAHKLTISSVNHRYWGNYTCRVYNPTAQAAGFRLMQASKRMWLNGEVRKSTSATERVTSSQAPVTESVDPCGWDRVGKNGDGILVAATIFLFITAILLSIIALALMKSTSSSKTYDVSETARSNALRNATSVSSVAKASDADNLWNMPASPETRSKSYRFSTGDPFSGNCQPISEELTTSDVPATATFSYQC